MTHRIGAIITGVFLTWLALMIFIKARNHRVKSAAVALFSLLVLQIGLGISNIWFSLPLNIAVAHNLVAACLMLSLITLAYKLRQNSQESLYE